MSNESGWKDCTLWHKKEFCVICNELIEEKDFKWCNDSGEFMCDDCASELEAKAFSQKD